MKTRPTVEKMNPLILVALGAVMYLSESYAGLTPETRIFLTIGVLGAYTTMSTFGYESFRLLEQGDNVRFALNVLGTNSLVIAGIWVGRIIAQRLSL
jgi:CrcB protein